MALVKVPAQNASNLQLIITTDQIVAPKCTDALMAPAEQIAPIFPFTVPALSLDCFNVRISPAQ